MKGDFIMPVLNEKIKTVILLMFENRSFDHLLGHLSYQGLNKDVDGIKSPLKQYENLYKGDAYNPYKMKDGMLPFDLPHEYDYVGTQLAWSNVRKEYSMSGFVEAYIKATGAKPNPKSEPMGFFTTDQAPISSFLAQNFCVCDRWFASLPTSTQPNRTIAFTGSSNIFTTETGLISIDDSIFDWFERNSINWRVYHDGFSFFTIYPHLWDFVFSKKFKDYENFHYDIVNESVSSSPQVIIIEPTYQDAPHIGSDRPNDNHAPLAIGWGEEFLRRTYESATANPEKWKDTVMILFYDEHGGFWDHVPPPHIGYTINGNPSHKFDSAGPRIPGIIISPYVEKNSVNHLQFDHTSVLQFLAELLTPGKPYSKEVEARKGFESISKTLNLQTSRNDIPSVPSNPIPVKTTLGASIEKAPTNGLAQSFEAAANNLLENKQEEVAQKYPELLQWKNATKNARN